MILLHSFDLISFSILEFILSGIFSSGNSKIFNLQYFDNLFEYSSIESLKSFTIKTKDLSDSSVICYKF